MNSGTPAFNPLFHGLLKLPKKFMKTCSSLFKLFFKTNKQTPAVTCASLVEVIKLGCIRQAVSKELSWQTEFLQILPSFLTQVVSTTAVWFSLQQKRFYCYLCLIWGIKRNEQSVLRQYHQKQLHLTGGFINFSENRSRNHLLLLKKNSSIIRVNE